MDDDGNRRVIDRHLILTTFRTLRNSNGAPDELSQAQNFLPIIFDSKVVPTAPYGTEVKADGRRYRSQINLI
jgi:hypothetical protein